MTEGSSLPKVGGSFINDEEESVNTTAGAEYASAMRQIYFLHLKR